MKQDCKADDADRFGFGVGCGPKGGMLLAGIVVLLAAGLLFAGVIDSHGNKIKITALRENALVVFENGKGTLSMTDDNSDIGLADFVGQPAIVEHLRGRVNGTKARNSPLEHTLLIGEPGLGKTTLARAVANAIGAGITEIGHTEKLTPPELAKAALACQPFGVLFIDEIHALPSCCLVPLQRLIKDGKVRVAEPDATGKIVEKDMEIARITVIGATDLSRSLPNSLYSLFGTPLMLRPCSAHEMTLVARTLACRLATILNDQAITLIAGASCGNPRQAKNLLKGIRDWAAWKEITDVSADNVRAYLRSAGIDERGLSAQHVAYLRRLNQQRKTGATLTALAAGFANARYIQRYVEPALLHLGFIQIDVRRRITISGIEYLGRTTI